jgi:hypothetical protein
MAPKKTNGAIRYSVSVVSRVVLGTDDETASLPGALINNLEDVDKFLLIVKHPVDFVVITCAKITHHVFVSVKELPAMQPRQQPPSQQSTATNPGPIDNVP